MSTHYHPADSAIRGLLLSIFFCLIAGSLSPAAGTDVPEPRCAQSGDYSLCVEKGFPTEGDPCWIRVTDGGAPIVGVEIAVTHRPNSEVMTVETIGMTDASGQLIWTPSDAGIATLEASGAGLDPLAMTLSVKFRRIPTLGIIMLMLAGMILFGGNGYSFAKTFAKKL